MTDWKPNASLEVLRQRSEMLSTIRKFFAERNVLEIETPLLCRNAATDVFIKSFEVSVTSKTTTEKRYLQTSPEYAMKRMLAAGSGPIFQICKSFRAEESSRLHNSEFTMLEWYRPAFSMFELMDEVELLVSCLCDAGSIPRFSYRELFIKHLQFDPHIISPTELKNIAEKKMELSGEGFSSTDYLQLLMDKCVEPLMPAMCFVFDYPVAQCALSKIEEDDQGQAVARRFEFYGQGMEIANGYLELTDSNEQRRRIENDIEERKQRGLASYSIDERLLAALDSGLPTCSGVALGIDRLLMLVTGNSSIDQVLSFTDTTA
ncbi:MAG: EF-P lysine aminoacylase GenX [Gammaproteobacteria bacterium]|jgi:lysyl-tRNA synthetase class 2|nr:EF-P lysine aminoacylase GenX [Gammaproteobacteria bacterium]MBT3860527.1 EF-P lysine aminoacylase GenX [Gammaproteobacteria bacterium]MBT3987347.1 EF-P lysine aminoacylase GenX [Gammaproteobacteria bacterium]MBT4256956.1 EF-P lysine aminoacylase GenX [Gammaproteobacteria bacterium]MBT4581915.1 EF-P lysine aminoacylase GenX [Gammaproteobacteria bacterium]